MPGTIEVRLTRTHSKKGSIIERESTYYFVWGFKMKTVVCFLLQNKNFPDIKFTLGFTFLSLKHSFEQLGV